MHDIEENMSLCLGTILKYIRGDLNLSEASEILETLGHNKNSAIKVLLDTHRNNIVKLNPKKKQKRKKNKTKDLNNIILLNTRRSYELKGLKGPDDDFYIDMEIEDFIALNEEDDECYFQVDFEN